MNVNQHDDTGMDGTNGQEWRLAGDDLNAIYEAIKILNGGCGPQGLFNTPAVITLDYGSVVEDPRQVTVQDLENIVAVYISLYGAKPKPSLFMDPDILV